MAKKNGVRWKSIGLKEERRITGGLVHHRAPVWSPDGKWLAFAVDAAWVVADRRGRPAQILTGPAEGNASFSPSGTLAFGRRVSRESTEIWMTAGLGLPAVRLLGGDGAAYLDPAFSPDGLTLAYASGGALHLLDVRSGARQDLPTEAGRSDGQPVWSPDGAELFFVGESEGTPPLVLTWNPLRNDLMRVGEGTHPAPVSRDLVIVERADGLTLIDRAAGREASLGVDDPTLTALRAPSVQRGKSGKVKLAFLATVEGRADVCAARVKGLGLDLEETDGVAAEVVA